MSDVSKEQVVTEYEWKINPNLFVGAPASIEGELDKTARNKK